MKHFQILAGAGLLLAASAAAQQKPVAHPDLSGTWYSSSPLAGSALKKQENGAVSFKKIDRSDSMASRREVPGALPSTREPAYKPEYQPKVKDLLDHESKTDPVFYCERPGTPRIGPPRRIVQLPNEMIFLYEDASGDVYRVIPTDGRPHRANANPSYYGDSVGHWEGNALVVDSRNFVDDTWFGEGGYFHTEAMHVTERLWRVGENLAYQVTVEDPNVLTVPWTAPVRVVTPSTDALEESPKCVETDGRLLLNNDHHPQR
jgi:hypothetical protein